MSHFRFVLSTLFAVMFSLIGVNTYAQDQETVVTTSQVQPNGTTQVIERHTIITPVPAAKEVIATPQGFVTCFTVDAGWYKDVWVPSHRVCQYENSGEGVAYVEGYWTCNKYTADGTCTNWVWKAGHWEKSLVIY